MENYFENTHYIDQGLSEILWDYYTKNYEPDADELEKKKVNDFILANATVNSLKYGDRPIPKVLTYETLPEFVALTGISYREVIQIAAKHGSCENTLLDWATELQAKMCIFLDGSPYFFRKYIGETIHALLSKDILAVLNSNDNSRNNRFYQAAELTMNVEVAPCFSDIILQNLWYLTKTGVYTHVVPLKTIPEVVLRTKFSPHFILGLDQGQCVLAKSGQTEIVMDLFCLLPEHLQIFIYETAQNNLGEL